MIIDFHTHIFPEELATKAKNTLRIQLQYEPVNDHQKR